MELGCPCAQKSSPPSTRIIWKMIEVNGGTSDVFHPPFVVTWNNSCAWPQPDLWGCVNSGLQHGQTQLYIWMNWAKGLCIFCFTKNSIFFFFAYSTMLFIEWNLRDFSPCWLQPSLFSKQGLRCFYICWDFRLFFFFDCPITVANSHGPLVSHR